MNNVEKKLFLEKEIMMYEKLIEHEQKKIDRLNIIHTDVYLKNYQEELEELEKELMELKNEKIN